MVQPITALLALRLARKLSLSDVRFKLSRSCLAAAGIVHTLLQLPPADGRTCGNTILISPRCKPRCRHADRSSRLPCMPDGGFQGNCSRFVTVGSSSEPVSRSSNRSNAFSVGDSDKQVPTIAVCSFDTVAVTSRPVCPGQ